MFDWMTGKKKRVSLSLSAESLEVLEGIADKTELALADVIEQLAHGQIALSSDQAQVLFVVSADGVTEVPVTDVPPNRTSAEATTSEKTDEAAPAHEEAVSPQLSPEMNAGIDDSKEISPAPPSPPENSVTASPPSAPQLEKASQPPEPMASADSSPASAAESAAVQQQISFLQNQLKDLQQRLTQKRDQQAAQQDKYLSLARKAAQQQQRIDELETQLTQLRQTAAIGEAQLNRWRFQNFSR